MALTRLKLGAITAGAVDSADLADDAVTSAKLDTNIDVAGTLDVTSDTTVGPFVAATPSSNGIQLKANGNLLLNKNGGEAITIYNDDSTKTCTIGSDGDLFINATDGTNKAKIENDGNGTFAGNIIASGATSYIGAYQMYTGSPAVGTATSVGTDMIAGGSGQFTSKSSSSAATTAIAWRGYHGTTRTSLIQVDGTAEFASSVSDSKGNLRSLPQNSQAHSYTLVAADAGKHIEAVATITIPNNVFSEGDMVTIVNNSAGDITLTKTITTMYNAADGTNASRTLASRGMCTILFMGGTEAFISGAGLS